MGKFNHDSYSEHEWDDGWEAVWSEADWEGYLLREEAEIRKYQKLYQKLIKSQNRLDEVAIYMGWDDEEADESGPRAEDESEDPEAAPPPYTLHQHPLFVASKALHGWLREKLHQRVAMASEVVPPEMALEIHGLVCKSDEYGLLTVTALDHADYGLATAYIKRGLAMVNLILGKLEGLEQLRLEPLPRFVQQARIRLFDIREIWLRVLNDCREAVYRQSDDDQS